ncbi:hypothetical protein ETD83_08170 [Actinomadura soli]|uniref:Uncharacterized protein n=1 Tax=Actinomadura soli TaxID=2508997 RepID=A0A5C4JFY8_9ACTN|nr:hypothetical protein [Actinomadura soli]TMR04749.1 hypothetical protein ETD83_08170 [Actinomadura soli]
MPGIEWPDMGEDAGVPSSYALEVLVFDDRVRARVGEISVEAVRGDLREYALTELGHILGDTP